MTENGQTYFQCREEYYEDRRQTERALSVHPYMAFAGGSLTGGQDDLLSFAAEQGDCIQKIGIMAFDEAAEQRILLYGAGLTGFDVMRTGRLSVEFNRKGTSKGRALEYLSSILGVEARQVIAIGDNENDIAMIDWAGIGIAMGNAPENVKAKAEFVTKSNEEEGVAWALETISVLYTGADRC